MKKLIIVAVLSIMCSALYSQERIVYGRVVVLNEFPLANIAVSAKMAKTAVLTDSLGMFAIACKKKDVLLFNSKHFEMKRKRVNAHIDSVMVNLVFSETGKKEKDEIIATGYGYMRKENSSYSVSNVTDENDDCFRYKDIYDMLAGKIPGVGIRSGEVVIRGVGTVNGNPYALIVINGTPGGELSTVSPCDVKHMSILKGPSAAIYGSRGANGVVVIETK